MKSSKLIVFGLITALSFSQSVVTFADDTVDEVTDADSLSTDIDTLQKQKDQLLGQIDDLEAKLVKAIASVNHVDSSLKDLQTKMKQTETDLASAQHDRDVQREAMKARIQYIYERGGDAGWISVFLNDGDINAWLNQNMTEDLYKYDRQQLENYAKSVAKVQKLQSQQQEEKSQLEKKKNSLIESKSNYESVLAEAKEKYSAADFDAKIADAQQKAAEYASLLAQQNDAISQVVTLQTAAAADTTAEEDSSYAADNSGETTYEAAGNTDTSTPEAQTAIQQVAAQLAAQTGTDVETATEAATQAYAQSGSVGNGSTPSGEALLQYAQQFLGNPYVYGGNSLTDGIDCSGFVQQVYANFGISTDRTSYDIANDGEEVSYNDAQVGDVFVYDGHVGIYAGNGQMINAADESQGITYTPVDYDQIQTIRRLLPDS